MRHRGGRCRRCCCSQPSGRPSYCGRHRRVPGRDALEDTHVRRTPSTSMRCKSSRRTTKPIQSGRLWSLPGRGMRPPPRDPPIHDRSCHEGLPRHAAATLAGIAPLVRALASPHVDIADRNDGLRLESRRGSRDAASGSRGARSHHERADTFSLNPLLGRTGRLTVARAVLRKRATQALSCSCLSVDRRTTSLDPSCWRARVDRPRNTTGRWGVRDPPPRTCRPRRVNPCHARWQRVCF